MVVTPASAATWRMVTAAAPSSSRIFSAAALMRSAVPGSVMCTTYTTTCTTYTSPWPGLSGFRRRQRERGQNRYLTTTAHSPDRIRSMANIDMRALATHADGGTDNLNRAVVRDSRALSTSVSQSEAPEESAVEASTE